MTTVTRFAPSPTGHLHLGHAYSALYAAQAAQQAGGKFLLRIEDIDPTRCRPNYTEDLLEDLAWLGLVWEYPVRNQSKHMADYEAALNRLRGMGLIYPCFCTRREIEAEVAAAGHAPHLPSRGGPDGAVYPGICRGMDAAEADIRIKSGDGHSFRLDMEKAAAMTGPLVWQDRERDTVTAQPQDFGDIVLARKETPTSYHLSVTVDDALQGVTLVTRGEDLLRATDIHRLLQALLGYETPAYDHHKMLSNREGERLSKRDGALTLRQLRAAGHSAAEVRAMAGFGG
ncbi:MAG: tRNA glutamyl-Q(34) synthetase GluQRS [Alphaproteobacteria bacterium]|nr:tRNA glutamyl-Q(34) synthetase GluQRS [Alphaproteobacteria bacterium]